jgi:hypothetical protein
MAEYAKRNDSEPVLVLGGAEHGASFLNAGIDDKSLVFINPDPQECCNISKIYANATVINEEPLANVDNIECVSGRKFSIILSCARFTHDIPIKDRMVIFEKLFGLLRADGLLIDATYTGAPSAPDWFKPVATEIAISCKKAEVIGPSSVEKVTLTFEWRLYIYSPAKFDDMDTKYLENTHELIESEGHIDGQKPSVRASLPETPPTLWVPRKSGRPPASEKGRLIAFLKDVYGPYMDTHRGQLRSYIFHNDRPLYDAITTYERREALPPEVAIPDRNDRYIERRKLQEKLGFSGLTQAETETAKASLEKVRAKQRARAPRPG